MSTDLSSLPPWPGAPTTSSGGSPRRGPGIVDIENAIGSRLALVALGLAGPLLIEGRYRLLELRGRFFF